MLASHFGTSLEGSLYPAEEWQRVRLSAFEEMDAVVESIVAALAGLGYSARDIVGTRLALVEAICNSIKHGHRHDPSKVVEVRYAVHLDHVLLEVEDEGGGFDLTKVPDATAPQNLERPSGRGLLMIRHYAAWVRHNPQGNCVAFCIASSDESLAH